MATVNGTAGNDTLSGTAAADTINGFGGNDTILGSTGNDLINGGDGFDSIEYKNAANGLIVDFAAGTISGGAAGSMSFTGIERIVAGSFNDQMTGSAGSQILTGQGGNDTIAGAGGNDTLWGGVGADSFVFREAGSANADSINDFASGSDNIQLDAAFFAALGAAGRFAAGDARFWSSSSGTAHDADDRIIYNTTTRQLWYDADGNGSGAAQLIATVNSGATVVATDLWVFGTSPGGGGGGNQTINGTSGNDSLVGGAGNDTINGFAGMDTIDGGPGADSMIGGDHDDIFIVDNTGDVVVEHEGGGSFDEVRASVTYTLPAWVNNLTLTGTAAINGTGNELDNVISGTAAANRLVGGDGNDRLFGGDGNDDLHGDNLDGIHGNDYLDGGAGNDGLWGGRGNDTMIGGAGDDSFVIDSGNSQFNSDNPGSDSIDGGAGTDSISFGVEGVSSTAAVTIDLTAGTYSIAEPGGQVNGIVINVENVQGSQFSDRITGTDGANVLRGLQGNDTIHGLGGNDYFENETGNATFFGEAGNDTLNGGWGADTLSGGLGNDVLDGDYTSQNSGGDSFLFDVAPGTANADVILEFKSSQDKIVLDGIAHPSSGASGNFTASDARFWSSGTGTAHDGDDRVIYNTSNGQLWYDADGNGTGAAQLIATLQGAPTMSATDVVIVNGSGGGGGGGGGAINGTAGNDSLVGGPGNDTINGFAGNDTIDGAGGNDSLIGGDGSDLILGGAGDDTLNGIGNLGSIDTLDGGLGNDTYDLGGRGGHVLVDAGGIDTVIVYNGGNLPDGFENLVVRNELHFPVDANGNSLDNVIRVESGSGGGGVYVDGQGGNDTIDGVGDFIIVQFGGTSFGNDTVAAGAHGGWIQFGSSAVVIDIAAGTATSSAGNVTFTGITTVAGSEAGDRITAGNAGSRIIGLRGDDTLIGGNGNDSIMGEGTRFDVPVETIGTGNDLIFGGAGNDTLQGNDGNDTLDGGLGNDRLGSGHVDVSQGNDTFMFTVAPGLANADVVTDFDSGVDRIVLDGNAHANTGPSGTFAAGDARFWSSGTGTAHDADDRVIYNTSNGELWYDADGNGAGARQLIATLEGIPGLTASDITIINGSGTGGGGGGGTTINGTSGNDTLSGTAGNDTINGLGGNDTILGSTGSDVIDGGTGFDSIEYKNAASALVVDFAAGTISGGVSGSMSFTGIERIVAGGFNDQITGDAASQILTGQGGNDTLAGAGGADTLWGGGGSDFFVFREMGTANADRISDWVSGADKVALDDAAFTSIGALGNFVAGDGRFWASSTGTAHDADDRVIYNQSTGSLYYDADGNGTGAAQLIATFTGNPTVAATDIVVI